VTENDATAANSEPPEDPFRDWNRPLPGVPEVMRGAYEREEFRDNALRALTARRHQRQINLWLGALTLFATAFAPGGEYSAGGPEPDSPEDSEEARIHRNAYALRLQLLALSGRAIKPALDLLLSGYYTESWTLVRTMLDGWARCIFVRLRPQEYVHWYDDDDEEDEEGAAKAKKPRKPAPNWGQIETAVEHHGDDDDRALFAEALLRWELLHMAAHPSGEGIDQIRNDELNIMMFRPEYHEGWCMFGFSLGAFVQRALLREVRLLGITGATWLQVHERFVDGVAPLENSARLGLDEAAARIQARREERRDAKKRRSGASASTQDEDEF
jgi:hypothetical protein